MRNHKVVVVLAVALLVGLGVGCRHRRQYQTVHNNYRNLMASYLTDGSLFKTYYTEKDGEKRKLLRNRVLNWCIWLSDDRFDRYESQLSTGKAIMDTLIDWGNLAASAAAAINPTSVGLGVAGTGLQGAGFSLQKNFFDQQTRSAIIFEMEACRKNRLVAIYQGETLSDGDYTLEQGLIDIQAYDNAGTIHAALVDIAQRASVSHAESNNKLRALHREP